MKIGELYVYFYIEIARTFGMFIEVLVIQCFTNHSNVKVKKFD